MLSKMAFVAGAAALATAAGAQISYNGGTISENFDSLASAGATPVTNIAWTNDSTLPGWFLFISTGDPAPTYNAHAGQNNTGSFYSLGSNDSSERALGGIASGGAYFGSPPGGAVAGWIAFAATNNGSGTLTEFTVGFDGEQWRNGGNTTAQSMVLEYGFGATFGTVTTWTAPGGLFDWTSPVATATAAAVDGNAAGLVAGLGGTISSLTWDVGDTLWIRWIENNDAGNDHGLAIDNFSFSAVPAPGAAALLGMGGLMIGRRRR
ncbi:MAG: hypothetical protein KF699_10695 [Phycisphaeraceae bacterium]|nr:hypothetical protein [Phycisphaeraceae bacterium]MBX3407098.1 hypothetical protein [Phycisphaeraceae bacterium]